MLFCLQVTDSLSNSIPESFKLVLYPEDLFEALAEGLICRRVEVGKWSSCTLLAQERLCVVLPVSEEGNFLWWKALISSIRPSHHSRQFEELKCKHIICQSKSMVRFSYHSKALRAHNLLILKSKHKIGGSVKMDSTRVAVQIFICKSSSGLLVARISLFPCWFCAALDAFSHRYALLDGRAKRWQWQKLCLHAPSTIVLLCQNAGWCIWLVVLNCDVVYESNDVICCTSEVCEWQYCLCEQWLSCFYVYHMLWNRRLNSWDCDLFMSFEAYYSLMHNVRHCHHSSICECLRTRIPYFYWIYHCSDCIRAPSPLE